MVFKTNSDCPSIYCYNFFSYLSSISHYAADTPKIHVTTVENNIISGWIESTSLCRLYFHQRSTDDITLGSAEKEANYLFSVPRNGNFSVFYNVETIREQNTLVFYVSCDNGLSRGILNYHVDNKYFGRVSSVFNNCSL